MSIGKYIHANYGNYLKYGLSYPDGDSSTDAMNEERIAEVFKRQRKEIYDEIVNYRVANKLNRRVIQKIEDQLNFFYNPVSDKEKKIGEISDTDIQNIEEAIVQKLFNGKIPDGIEINPNNLSMSSTNSELTEILKYLSSRKSIGAHEKTDKVQKKAIESRLNSLIKFRAKIAQNVQSNDTSTDTLIKEITALERDWNNIIESLGEDAQKYYLSTKNKDINAFVSQLNNLVSSFTMPSKSIQGSYAEAVTVLASYITNVKGTKSVEQLLKILNKRQVGTAKSKKGLMSCNFNTEFVDLDKVVKDTSYKFEMEDGAGNYFTAHETQDKVDVKITFNGLEIPASVKNYNMANTQKKYEQVHLLSGRSVLSLVQNYDYFLNHYLNVVSAHTNFGGESPSASLCQQAQAAMKLTILLKAIVGGVNTNKGVSEKAALFIINDNSGVKGKFRVYDIDTILKEAKKDLSLVSTGSFDEYLNGSALLDNKFMGDPRRKNKHHARSRISILLNQLHTAQLKVGINKKVFSRI